MTTATAYKVPPRTSVVPFRPPQAMPRANGTGNGSVAPVCPTSKSQELSAQPGIMLPQIPAAVDLPSALLAINQMRQIINFLVAPSVTNLFGSPLLLNLQVPNIRSNWQEIHRVSQVDRVYSPLDKSVWVDVERINSLTMKDQLTGNVLQWNYKLQKAPGGGASNPPGTTPGN